MITNRFFSWNLVCIHSAFLLFKIQTRVRVFSLIVASKKYDKISIYANAYANVIENEQKRQQKKNVVKPLEMQPLQLTLYVDHLVLYVM